MALNNPYCEICIYFLLEFLGYWHFNPLVYSPVSHYFKDSFKNGIEMQVGTPFQ